MFPIKFEFEKKKKTCKYRYTYFMEVTLMMNEEELQKKREEAERKARRGEIDPTHEFTFHLIGQVVLLQIGISKWCPVTPCLI